MDQSTDGVDALAAERAREIAWESSELGAMERAIGEQMGPIVRAMVPTELRARLEADAVMHAAAKLVGEGVNRLWVQVIEDEGRWRAGGTVETWSCGAVGELELAIGGRIAFGLLS